MIPADILIAEVNRLRALLHEQNTTICQTLAAAMGCYPHAPDEHGDEDPSAPHVVDPAVAEDVAQAAADMIRELRAEVASLRQGWQAERDAALRAHDLLIAEREAARGTP